MSLFNLFQIIEKGGSGSGNRGHAGIPGHRGGSTSNKGGNSITQYKDGVGNIVLSTNDSNLNQLVSKLPQQNEKYAFIFNPDNGSIHVNTNPKANHDIFSEEALGDNPYLDTKPSGYIFPKEKKIRYYDKPALLGHYTDISKQVIKTAEKNTKKFLDKNYNLQMEIY